MALSDNANLRVECFGVLRTITGRDGPKRFLLAKLMGKTSWISVLRDFTEEDQQTCRALLGPHGKTIYKMLLIQHDLEDQDYAPEVTSDWG